jgi:signal peptidase I
MKIPIKVNLLFFAVLPVLLVITAVCLNHARGPYWLRVNLDPDYVYLLNASNLAHLQKPGHIDHPGTTVQVLGAITLRVFHFFDFSSKDDLKTDVLKRPEYYLNAINTVMVALNAIVLFILGFVTYKLTRNTWLSLWLQAAPFFSNVILGPGLSRVTPEPLLFFACLLLILILVIFLHTQAQISPGTRKGYKTFVLMFSLVIGFGIAGKITFLPLAVIPILALPRLKNKIFYFFAAILSFIFFTLPIIGQYGRFFSWVSRLLTHKGRYGTGEKIMLPFPKYIKNIIKLITGNPFFSVILCISLVILILAFIIPRMRKLSLPHPAFKLLTAVTLSQIFCLLMVARHAGHHYLLPGLCLSGITLFLIFSYLKNLLPAFKIDLNYLKFSFILFIISVFIFINPYVNLKKMILTKSRLKNKSLAIYQEVATTYKDHAKIYYRFSSSPHYALWFGNILSSNFHADVLGSLYKDVYFFNTIKNNFYGYDDSLPILFGRIQGKYGDKIVFQGSKRVKIPGLRLKNVYKETKKSKFPESIFKIDPQTIKAVNQAFQWIETNIEKGSTLVFPEELAMGTASLQNDYNIVFVKYSSMDIKEFYQLPVLLNNPYFLVPSFKNNGRRPISGGNIKKLKEAGEKIEIQAFFPGKKTPELSIGRMKPGLYQQFTYKELKVWFPQKKIKRKIAPWMNVLARRGKFQFKFRTEEKNKVLVVSYPGPGEAVKPSCLFGYKNKKGLQLKNPGGKYIYFMASVNIPGHLVNKENYLFIRDFGDKLNKKMVYFSNTGWLTYLVSLKIQPKNENLQFGFNFVPQCPGDKLKIKDVKIFIIEENSKRR